MRPPPISTLFPYTTLFRSNGEGALEVLARARALEASGRQVAHVEVGEPDFPTPPHVVEAGARALRNGDTRYTPARSEEHTSELQSLRHLVCRLLLEKKKK